MDFTTGDREVLIDRDALLLLTGKLSSDPSPSHQLFACKVACLEIETCLFVIVIVNCVR